MTTTKAPCITEGLPAPVRILRMAEVTHIVGLSRATIYRLIAQGVFTTGKPYQPIRRVVACRHFSLAG